MLYNASEAHLFRCKGVDWIGSTYLLVPDSFSTLGVTTPKKEVGTLEQGIQHLKGTDVCHVAYTGAALDARFEAAGSPVTYPPLDRYSHSAHSRSEIKRQIGGDQYTVEFKQQRNLWQNEWNHGIYTVRLDYSIPVKDTGWIRSWDNSYQRDLSVSVIYEGLYTPWVTVDWDHIQDYPHIPFVERYEYGLSQTSKSYPTPSTIKFGVDTIKVGTKSLPPLENLFYLLDEKHYFVDQVVHRGLVTSPWYGFNQGPKASAFLGAVKGFPTMESNSWANMLEIISLIKDLKRGKFSKAADVPKKWYEWWLQYRYRYSTTKSDVESMCALKKNLKSFHDCFGEYRRNVYGVFFDGATGITWRCEVQAVNRAANQIEQIYHGFATLGFDVSIYNLWDIIPYSFVLDWIFPVGDISEQMQQGHYLSSDYWDYESICYSASYTRGVSSDDSIISATVYDRWYESSPPNLDQYYWFEEHSTETSLKTGIFRLIDGMSLLVAGRQ